MHFHKPQTYTITRPNTNYVSEPLFGGHSATTEPKVYAFHRDRLVLYIGETIQTMAGRMQLASNRAPGNGGWIWGGEPSASARLTIWTQSDAVDRDNVGTKQVEAELATLIQFETGRWPETQVGLRVGNFSDGVKIAAKRLFAELKEIMSDA